MPAPKGSKGRRTTGGKQYTPAEREQRRAIVLDMLIAGGASYSDAAAVLGISVNQVKRDLHAYLGEHVAPPAEAIEEHRRLLTARAELIAVRAMTRYLSPDGADPRDGAVALRALAHIGVWNGVQLPAVILGRDNQDDAELIAGMLEKIARLRALQDAEDAKATDTPTPRPPARPANVIDITARDAREA